MLFHTTRFLIFLGIVLQAFYLSPRRFRRRLLLAASYFFFYLSWNAKFIVLIWVLTAIDYTAAIWMTRVPPGPRRRAWLVVSLANLGFLGFFKYFNFLAGNVAMLLGKPAGAFALDIRGPYP
jgi:D-alanyl-lipoteichoic acid acyltransferase DltB (MBOAT superfamily)